MATTIRDVAEQAGVSIATVSRVLNNTVPVNAEKRKRVEDAVEELGFIPNQAARSLVQRKTKGIGVLLPSLGGEFFSEFLKGVDEATRACGHYVLISASHGDLKELGTALRGMSQRVDGLVIMSPQNEGESIKPLIPEDTHVILINGNRSNTPYDTINIDNYRGGYIATEHLIKLGHRRIAMLKGLAHTHDGEERLRGYRDALKAYAIPHDHTLEFPGDFSPEGGHSAGEQILALSQRPTAIFCANDQSAIGLMGALQSEGIDIPGDISVVGFDGIPGVRFTVPPLTSIRADIRQLGSQAIERFLAMDKDPSLHHHVLPVELEVRDSTRKI